MTYDVGNLGPDYIPGVKQTITRHLKNGRLHLGLPNRFSNVTFLRRNV